MTGLGAYLKGLAGTLAVRCVGQTGRPREWRRTAGPDPKRSVGALVNGAWKYLSLAVPVSCDRLFLGSGLISNVGLNPIDLEIIVRSTQQFSITLPNEMAEAVRAKVAAGEYATESEVIRDGLRSLLARDRAVENWLRDQVGPAYDALKADPSRAVSVDQVRAKLAEEHRKAITGR